MEKKDLIQDVLAGVPNNAMLALPLLPQITGASLAVPHDVLSGIQLNSLVRPFKQPFANVFSGQVQCRPPGEFQALKCGCMRA